MDKEHGRRERGPAKKGAGANGTGRVLSMPVQVPVLLFFHFNYSFGGKPKQLKSFLRISFLFELGRI